MFLTHTVQMKPIITAENPTIEWKFLTHTVQMKRYGRNRLFIMFPVVLNPHGSDETSERVMKITEDPEFLTHTVQMKLP